MGICVHVFDLSDVGGCGKWLFIAVSGAEGGLDIILSSYVLYTFLYLVYRRWKVFLE